MAKLETKRIIASSLDNFIIFQNPYYQPQPYVTIGVASTDVGQNRYITFSDMDDSDAATITIEGKPGANITARSFNTAGSVTQVLFSLMETLKKVSILYDVTVGTSNTLKMGIDTSRRWRIESDMAIGGNFATFNPDSETKWVMNLNLSYLDNVKQFTMEKYNNSDEVSFNVSAPLQYIAFNNPLSLNLLPYSVNAGVVSVEALTNASLLVMPTTLYKFETVDYEDYYLYVSNNTRKKFLTRLDRRPYNYGERIALSVLTNRSMGSVNLMKKYYTNSGVFIASETGQEYKIYTNERLDFYDVLSLYEVETANNRQVGYVEVTAVSGGVELTEPVRYDVEPVCTENNTLFFINAIGGVDSFSFNGGWTYTSEISENTTYMKNPEKPFDGRYELEFVKRKEMDEKHTVATRLIDQQTARWLTELQKSKWVYKYLGGDQQLRYMMVVVDNMDIEVNDTDKRFTVEIEYHNADTKINI